MALFNILIDIATRTASFEQGMRSVERQLDSFGQTAKKVALAGLEFAGIGLSFNQLASSIGQAISRGEQMQQLSERMKTTTENLTQLEYAAKQAEVPFQLLADSLDVMQKNTSMAAEGTGRAKQAFEDLGIKASDLVKLSLDKQFGLIADKISSLSNSTDQTRVAMQIFGAAGAQLLPILQGGSAGIEKLRNEADKLGFTLSGQSAKALEETNKAITRLSASWIGFSTTLTGTVAPALANVFDSIRQVIHLTDDDRIQNRIKQLRQQLQAGPSFSPEQRTQFERELAQLTSTGAQFRNAFTVQHIFSPSVRAEMADNFAYLEKEAEKLAKFSPVDHWFNPQTILEMQRNFQYLEELQKRSAEIATQKTNINPQVLQEMQDNFQYLEDLTKKHTNTMSYFAQQAAMSMQNAFAQFLFDPFAGGVRGMAKGFIDAIRTMLANQEALAVFKWLGSWGNSNSSAGGLLGAVAGFIGGAFGSAKAGGGDVHAGTLYQVNENNTEFFKPSVSGTIIPLASGGSAGGGLVLNYAPAYSIDARGATQDAIKLLPAALKQTEDRAVARISDMIRRGRLMRPQT